MIQVDCTRGEVKNPGGSPLKMLAEGRQQMGKSKKKLLGWKEENLRKKGQEVGMIRGITCCTCGTEDMGDLAMWRSQVTYNRAVFLKR